MDAFYQARCGCWKENPTPRRAPWFYKPQLYWFGWRTLLPVSRGGDEYCRYTLVLGWNITGQIVIPYRDCRGGDEGCGPEWVNSSRIVGLDDELVHNASFVANGDWTVFSSLLDLNEEDYLYDEEEDADVAY